MVLGIRQAQSQRPRRDLLVGHVQLPAAGVAGEDGIDDSLPLLQLLLRLEVDDLQLRLALQVPAVNLDKFVGPADDELDDSQLVGVALAVVVHWLDLAQPDHLVRPVRPRLVLGLDAVALAVEPAVCRARCWIDSRIRLVRVLRGRRRQSRRHLALALHRLEGGVVPVDAAAAAQGQPVELDHVERLLVRAAVRAHSDGSVSRRRAAHDDRRTVVGHLFGVSRHLRLLVRSASDGIGEAVRAVAFGCRADARTSASHRHCVLEDRRAGLLDRFRRRTLRRRDRQRERAGRRADVRAPVEDRLAPRAREGVSARVDRLPADGRRQIARLRPEVLVRPAVRPAEPVTSARDLLRALSDALQLEREPAAVRRRLHAGGRGRRHAAARLLNVRGALGRLDLRVARGVDREGKRGQGSGEDRRTAGHLHSSGIGPLP